MKLLDLPLDGKIHKVQLFVDAYDSSPNIRVRVIDWFDEDNAGLFLELTIDPREVAWSPDRTFVPSEYDCLPYCAYLNLGRNEEWIYQWIVENNLATPTGIYDEFGYQMYEFNPDILMEYDREGNAEYLEIIEG